MSRALKSPALGPEPDWEISTVFGHRILELRASGATIRAIASTLHSSIGTVSRAHAYGKCVASFLISCSHAINL